MKHLTAALLVVLLAVGSAQASIVSHNPKVTVIDDVIRLGDLFSNAGDKADIVVGHAPQFGRRAIFDANWLYEVARAHKLGWRPRSRFDRVIVKRASQTIGAQAIEGELVAALAGYGLGDGAELELDNSNLKLVISPNVAPSLAVSELRYDKRSNRFSGLIEAPADNPTASAPVSGRIFRVIDIPVLARRINKGEVINNGDIAWVRVRANSVARDTITSADLLVGMAPRRGLTVDKPVHMGEVQPPVVVKKGNLVTMLLRTDIMTLTAQGRAIDNGARGDTIRVMNTQTAMVVEGRVAGPDTIIITPFSAIIGIQE